MKLSFHRLVQREVNDAIQWYEQRGAGLGEDFFNKLTTTLNAIVANPESQRFWLASNTVRRAQLKRFPYAVLYEVRPGQIRVLCVRHDKQHPRYGMSR